MDKQNIIIYKTGDGKASVVLYARDGNVWLTQKQLAELFATSRPNITMHISNILKEKELDQNSVCKDFLLTATDGKNYSVAHYSLPMILAVGFRVSGVRGMQFRQWANRHLQHYMVKGFVMDDERLKNPDGRPDYFDEMLARIRDIRASEKRFYQKIRDLFALSSDYDTTDKATQMFFAEVQNKLLFAVTNETAAEIIIKRANSSKENLNHEFRHELLRQWMPTDYKKWIEKSAIDYFSPFISLWLACNSWYMSHYSDLNDNRAGNNIASDRDFIVPFGEWEKNPRLSAKALAGP